MVAEYGLGFNYSSENVDSLRTVINNCNKVSLTVYAKNVVNFFNAEIELEQVKTKIANFLTEHLGLSRSQIMDRRLIILKQSLTSYVCLNKYCSILKLLILHYCSAIKSHRF